MKITPISPLYSNKIRKNCHNENYVSSKNNFENISILNSLSLISNYNLSFCAVKKPLYAIDKDGKYEKFPGRKEAVDKLKINGSSISQCLKGQRLSAGGYIFFLAEDIESVGNNGEINVDEVKIQAKLNEIEQNDPFAKTKKAIYSISADGTIKRYDSLAKAAEDIGNFDTNISKCLKGKQKLVSGYGFVYADEIEDKDENGSIKLNREKIKEKIIEVKQYAENQVVPRPFYAVDQDGKYIKFERQRDAEEQLGIQHSAIRKCLDKERYTANDYMFFYADEVEQVDKNGNIIVRFNLDDDKFGTRTPVSVYSINEKGELTRHSSLSDAEKKTGASRRNIDNCLRGERETALGYAYIKADEIEITDDTGRKIIDNNKVNEKFKQVIKKAIYVVNQDGDYIRYDNAQQAAQALDVTETAVVFTANGLQKTVKGNIVVKAQYIESFDGKKVVINENLLKKFIDQAQKSTEKPVWAIDKDGKRRRFRNKEAASLHLGISVRMILKCLNHEQKTTSGYRFVYENQGEKKRRNHRIYYAMNGNGDVFEFDNINEACKALGVTKEEFKTFLRKGRTKDRQKTLNGYVLSTSNDE